MELWTACVFYNTSAFEETARGAQENDLATAGKWQGLAERARVKAVESGRSNTANVNDVDYRDPNRRSGNGLGGRGGAGAVLDAAGRQRDMVRV